VGVAPGIEALLAHTDWVRALARSLLRDPARAADLEQELWLRVLRRPPPVLDDPRPWLATVLRRLAFTGARSGRRRREHEGRAGVERSTPAGPAEEVLLEAERARDLAALVLELAPPEREVVLLRYYRDLPPRRMATELGRPLATVKAQLHRGLAELRARLDRRHGGRDAWAALFLPLAWPRATGLGLATKLALAACSSGALVLAWRFWPQRAQPEQAAPAFVAESRAETEPSVGLVPARESEAASGAGERSALVTPPAVAEPPPRFPASRFETLVGRLVSPHGEPWAGIRVRALDRGGLAWADERESAVVGQGVYLLLPEELRDDPAARAAFVRERFEDPREALALLAGQPHVPDVARTDARGLFRLTVRAGTKQVALEDQGLHLIGHAPPRERFADELEWHFAARARDLHGVVLDATGVPLADVEVTLGTPVPKEVSQRVELGRGVLCPQATTRSDAGGAFILAAPEELDFWVDATAEDVSEHVYLEPGHWPESLELVLGLLPSSVRPVLRGRVVRPDGGAVAGAVVLCGPALAECDGEGRFHLGLSAPLTGEAILFVAPGFDPRVDEVLGARLAGASGAIELGDLALPDTALELSGRVLDREGRPVAGVALTLADPTHSPARGLALEELSGGQALLRNSDANGRFRFTGLFARPYTLELPDLALRFGPFSPSRDDLVLRLP
jgi:RNA polymerase sigma-70 factor (ECF subfamily)